MALTDFGAVPAGSVLPCFFTSHDLATGANEAASNLAVGDILVYKGTSMTQRSSTAGLVLIDTDGLDLDGLTGVNGVSIDTGDNTDAGFYAVGSFFNVVLGPITIDVQTVYVHLATFRIVAAESVTGTPKADMSALGGVAQSATDLKDFADDGYDPSTNKVQGVVLTDTLTTYTGDTPQTGDSYARIGAAGAGLTAVDDALITLIGAAGAGLTALATQASVNTIDDFLDTEIAAILAAVDTEVAAIKAVTDLLTAAQAEPTGVPAANATPLNKLGYVFAALRNRIHVDSNSKDFYDDGGSVLWSKALSDDGTDYNEGEGA